MRLAVIGTGHVGLVAGVGFSEFGHDVTIVGEDEVLVAALQRGELDRYEPGLEPLLQDNLAAERVRFTTDLEAAVRAAEVVVIAIVTALSEDGTTDLTDLFRIADRIGKVLDDYKVIVTKSTVPVGTSDRLALRISAHSSTKFAVASNPAFLKEGDAVADFMKPDRIVIGKTDAGAEAILRRLYAPFVRTSNRIMVVDPRSAELAKFASSALLATRISFMNELSRLADQMGADVERVRRVL
ncbi:MAG: nucleotide sugar dehydrogenase, partial [Myxococcota bacterium]